MASKLGDRSVLDLPDSLARKIVQLAELGERVVTFFETESLAQNIPLHGGKFLQGASQDVLVPARCDTRERVVAPAGEGFDQRGLPRLTSGGIRRDGLTLGGGLELAKSCLLERAWRYQ